MSKYLTTLPGKYGDILWGMATVKAISEMLLGGEKVDFGCMPQYESLIPFLQEQPYIDKAFVVPDWVFLHSNYGDQPWTPPARLESGYEKVWNLGYRHHPGLSGVPGDPRALIDFIAHQQGIKLKDPIPFLFAEVMDKKLSLGTVAVALNDQYAEVKERFYLKLTECLPGTVCMRVDKIPWLLAATMIKAAGAFVGCRSANNVIAHGVGQQNIFIFEPHPSRHAQGHLGDVFGCTYGAQEITSPFMMPAEAAAEMAADQIRVWQQQRETEVTCST